jgi:carboxyl-terminal processing protease
MNLFVKKIASYILVFIFAMSMEGVNAQERNQISTEMQDFGITVRAIDSTMRAHIYDISVLETPQFYEVQRKVNLLASQVHERKKFIDGFNQIWSQGPFSHVRINEKRQTAEQLANYLDTMRIAGNGAVLSWQNDIAVLTVSTMMGQNTIDQIYGAFKTLNETKPKALILDLRNNEGGAFAVRPLISHLLSSNLEAGIFLSQSWTKNNHSIPSDDYIHSLTPWQGWSIKSFWRDVEVKGVLRIVFEPMSPQYVGPVYVLINKQTASAAELAADALLASGRAVLVGEKTGGQMLSQKMYDLPQGLQLFLPIADYYALHSGRIEGAGVMPQVIVESDMAMEKTLELISAPKSHE